MEDTEASPSKLKKRARGRSSTPPSMSSPRTPTKPLHSSVTSPRASTLPPASAEPPVRFYRHSEEPNRLQLVVRPPESNVAFVGSIIPDDPTASQSCSLPTLSKSCTYALGVLDKKSQTLRIVPIACNEDKKMQSLRQEDDPNTQKDLDRKIKEVAINKEALESMGSHTAHNIPPYNSCATVPKDAYPIERIILKGEWDYIRDILQLLEAIEKVSPDAYPMFVCNRIHKLGETQDEMEKEMLGCIFLYINHLIKFKDQHSADGATSAKNHRTPSILCQKFPTMFSNTESKWLPSEKIDLLISYVLVLTLFADDFWTDPTDIAKDLRMNSVTIRHHFEHLGCKLSREKNVLYVKLPVPLKFPELRKRHGR